jgi:cell division protein FtsQ
MAQPDDAPGEHASTRDAHRRRLLLIAGAVVVVAAAAVWVVAFSSLLGVRTVRVQGVSVVSAGQVRAAAAVPNGRPLVRLDTGAIVRRVERLPAVRSADVFTTFPGTVTIRVTERTAVGYLPSAGRYVLVDANGVQYLTVSSKPARLPQFGLPAGADSTTAARGVATVASALGPQLLARVASIDAFDQNAITVLLTDSRVLHWGSADRSSDKARLLPTLLGQPGTQFDVSNPDQVVVR